MITRLTIKCGSHIDACTVFGYFKSQYMCLSLRDSNIELIDSHHEVEIRADDSFDRTIDFDRSIKWLNSKGIKCQKVLQQVESNG
jgi:hypothetical protein